MPIYEFATDRPRTCAVRHGWQVEWANGCLMPSDLYEQRIDIILYFMFAGLGIHSMLNCASKLIRVRAFRNNTQTTLQLS